MKYVATDPTNEEAVRAAGVINQMFDYFMRQPEQMAKVLAEMNSIETMTVDVAADAMMRQLSVLPRRQGDE